jgi:hypothetical protein
MMTSSVSKSGGDNSSSNNMSGKPPFAGLIERGGKFIQSSTFNTNRGGASTTSSSNIHRGGNQIKVCSSIHQIVVEFRS